MGMGSIPKARSSDNKMTQSCRAKRIVLLQIVKGDFRGSIRRRKGEKGDEDPWRSSAV